MNNPIKIIHKYKNDNRRVQYNYYIFVGSLVNQNVRKILLKIQSLSLFDTLLTLTDKEIKMAQELVESLKVFMKWGYLNKKNRVIF